MLSKTLGILDCDELAEELREDYACYSDMFSNLLGPLCAELEIRSYQVLQGELPESATECDAYLVTGSKTGVYDNEPWLAPLANFLISAYYEAVPLIGICFGHQMLANILGGKAKKSQKGWGIGALKHQPQMQPDWMQPMPENLCLLYSHQDQVVGLPDGAVRLFGSDFCEFGAYWQPGRLLAFQGHPEFTSDYSQRLMTLRQNRYAPGQYAEALKTLSEPTNEKAVARWMIDFIFQRDL